MKQLLYRVNFFAQATVSFQTSNLRLQWKTFSLLDRGALNQNTTTVYCALFWMNLGQILVYFHAPNLCCSTLGSIWTEETHHSRLCTWSHDVDKLLNRKLHWSVMCLLLLSLHQCVDLQLCYSYSQSSHQDSSSLGAATPAWRSNPLFPVREPQWRHPPRSWLS